MEKRKFEDSFRDAFQRAEMSPSEDVWTNIELDLEKLESGKMRRRLLFFKLLAAASVVFAMVMGGVGYLVLTEQSTVGPSTGTISEVVTPHDTASSPQETTENTLAESDTRTPASDTYTEPVVDAIPRTEDFIAADNTDRHQAVPAPSLAQKGKSTSDRESPAEATPSDTHASTGAETSNRVLAAVNPEERVAAGNNRDKEYKELVFRDRALPPLVRARKPVVQFPKTRPDSWDLLLASMEMEEKKEKEKKKGGEKVWTSVGFSAGTFSNAVSSSAPVTSAGFNTVGPMSIANSSAFNSVSNETRASGSAYAMGVSMGGRIASRWVLQGGLNFISQTSDYMSNAVITSDYQNFKTLNAAEATRLDSYSSARLVPTASYSVSNNIQFLSIPLQAGYVVINRAFAVQINGGFSTDLFLQNVSTPESGSLEKVTTTYGDDSPFRSVNFVGLAGTEFSYRFAERYRIAVNPGLRYPFQSMYKSDAGIEAVPVTFDIGLRFRYIFR